MSKDNGMRLGWIGAGRMGYALASGCSARATTSRSTTARAPRPNRSPSTARRSSSARRSRRPRHRLHDGRRLRATSRRSRSARRRPLARRRRAAHPRSTRRTISPGGVASDVRDAAAQRGTALLAAPVSGNPKVVAAGRLTIVVSGPREASTSARPTSRRSARASPTSARATRARLVKICHNLMLGIVAQTLAEITVLAEKGGVCRADFLAFLNDSVMGSMFTRYKTPAT